MKNALTLVAFITLCYTGFAQGSDTLQVQHSGDKMFVVIERPRAAGDNSAPVYDTLAVQNINGKMVIVMEHPFAAVPPPPSLSPEALISHKKIESNFMVVGLTTFGLATTWTKTNSLGVVNKSVVNSFGDQPNYEFSPMFLWRHGDKLLLEFEPSFDGNGIGVNWADMTYFVTNGLMIRAGYFVLPFGTYAKRLAAGWINKLATDPVGIGFPPSSDWGIELSGGAQAGKMKVNYDVAVTNGFQLLGDGTIQNANGSGIVDNNLGKTVTARFGWLPFSNSCLELGVSGLFSGIGDAGSVYKDAKSYMGAADLQFVYTVNPITINIKGQYNMQYVSRQNYINPSDSTQSYSFNNLQNGYFALLSLRPSQGPKFIRNLEFAGRYSRYTAPTGSLWQQDVHQITAGLAYWITWRTVFKLTWERQIQYNEDNTAIGGSTPWTKTVTDFLYAQISVQF